MYLALAETHALALTRDYLIKVVLHVFKDYKKFMQSLSFYQYHTSVYRPVNKDRTAYID